MLLIAELGWRRKTVGLKSQADIAVLSLGLGGAPSLLLLNGGHPLSDADHSRWLLVTGTVTGHWYCHCNRVQTTSARHFLPGRSRTRGVNQTRWGEPRSRAHRGAAAAEQTAIAWPAI